MLTTLLAASLSVSFSSASTASDWPRFLGPNGDGSVAPIDSDFAWGDEGPAIAWRLEIGRGYGGVAVAGGRVYLLDREAGERDVVRAFDLESGAELWSDGYAAPGRLQFQGSRTVPWVEDGYAATMGGFGHLAAFDLEGEALDWLIDLREEYGGELPMFGYSAAPLVYDGLVIAPALGPEVGLVAIELESGAEIWTTAGVGHSHSTPALVELGGRELVLFLSTTERASGNDVAAPSTLTAFDPDSGEPVFQHSLTLTRLPIPGPVQVDGETLFLTGGYRSGSKLLRVVHDEDAWAFEELFAVERGAQTHRPILHRDHLYVLANENWNYGRRQTEGGLMCLSLGGEELWRTGDQPFFGRGNMVLAGEHLLIQDGFDGTLRVVRATPESYQQVAEAAIFKEPEDRDGQMWAPMALCGQRLLMRSQDELVCVRL